MHAIPMHLLALGAWLHACAAGNGLPHSDINRIRRFRTQIGGTSTSNPRLPGRTAGFLRQALVNSGCLAKIHFLLRGIQREFAAGGEKLSNFELYTKEIRRGIAVGGENVPKPSLFY